MKRTSNLNLPLYENTDKYYIDDFNEAYSKIDEAYGGIQETINIVGSDKLIITQEVIDSRGGKESLGDRLNEIDNTIEDVNKTIEDNATDVDVKISASEQTTNQKLSLIDGKIASIETNIDNNEILISEKEKQSNLLSKAYHKLNKKENIKIVCQGDSLTYGHDTISADIVSPSGATDNGVNHSSSRASKTYPSVLQSNLRAIYNNSITVINKGFSGDYAELSYEHWNNNSNADLAFIMLGTNEAHLGATYVPSDVRGNTEKFLISMRKIIRRYLSWNTAVILLTPPRTKDNEIPSTTNGIYLEPFRHAIKLLGFEFGCPVIDTDLFLSGCNNTYYSDGVHLNSKGYEYFASRLVSTLIGYGVKNPVQIIGGSDITVRQSKYNFVSEGVITIKSSGTPGADDIGIGEGTILRIDSGNKVWYSFETLEDNLILIPITNHEAGVTAKFDLDFGLEQGAIPLLSAVGTSSSDRFKPQSSIVLTTTTNDTNINDGSITLDNKDKYIWITNKGWHNIKIQNIASVNNTYFSGFIVMSYNDFKNVNRIFHRPLYPAYTDNPSTITKVSIYASELNNFFKGNKIAGVEYWKAIPLKVVLHNYDSTIIEHGFIWHDNGLGFVPQYGFYNWLVKKTDLVTSPSSVRTISSISYDAVNRKYDINFSGATNMLGSITIQPL